MKTIATSTIVRAGTDLLPELRLMSVGSHGVVFAVDGRAHHMTWRVLGAWASVIPGEVTAVAPDVTAAYRAVYDAADRVRREHTSKTERLGETITGLVEEGRRLRDRNDVVGEAEIIRTLDMFIGRWVDGKWIGGQAAILGTWSTSPEERA